MAPVEFILACFEGVCVLGASAESGYAIERVIT
jgi:hypothetical protein